MTQATQCALTKNKEELSFKQKKHLAVGSKSQIIIMKGDDINARANSHASLSSLLCLSRSLGELVLALSKNQGRNQLLKQTFLYFIPAVSEI